MFYDSPGQGYLSIVTGGVPQGAAQHRNTVLPMFALSEPITIPVPEPSTLTLCVFALLFVGRRAYSVLKRKS
jgi:hypothetical protein